MEELRFRQIHMDFHTSEKINDICEEFDENEFAETLERAHVNSVTCFSRCHHGMLYYKKISAINSSWTKREKGYFGEAN